MKSPIMKRLDALVFSSVYADLHDLLALCESSLHWLDIWLLTFIVPWGRDCNVNTGMLYLVPINIHGSPVCQKPLRLSHFKTWWHYCPEQITEALFRRAAKIQFLLHPTQTRLVFLGWTNRNTHEIWYIYKSIYDYVWNGQLKPCPCVVWNPIKIRFSF